MNDLWERAEQAGAIAAPHPRVVIAEPGLDGHDRGATVIAEDAPLLGLSVLSGAHLTIVETAHRLTTAGNELESAC
ncbi:hypothetical protein [Streptomyces sp. MK37H]|uniref:hypothetical protein n=1 Tax=Streptomyces sp. MK37H TaxID=2699117 RepID=UPI001B39659E|nr:hypothetical protein [Streptomyces sp. MK37H]MBP8531734.1 hypothetical protein [Streptomyces sp. MK37H]